MEDDMAALLLLALPGLGRVASFRRRMKQLAAMVAEIGDR
jgi:hypothetical protein